MPRSNADTVRLNSDAFSRRDMDAMLELHVPEPVVIDRRPVGFGEFHGRDAVRSYYEGVFDNASDLREDLSVVSDEDDVVVASCHLRLWLAGVDGDEVTFDYALRFGMDGGLIATVEIFEDAAAATGGSSGG